jgi:hypothetical protein
MEDPELSVEAVHRGFFPVRDLLDRCTGDDDEIYIPGVSMRDAQPLANDVDTHDFMGSVPVQSVSIFLGQNTRCLGHMHPFGQAVLTQVVGQKEVLLYSPEDMGKLYMRSCLSSGFFQSRVNFHSLHPERFPRLNEATPWRVRLDPGDALFIPVHWLHVPVGFGFTVSVTHWWRAKPTEWGSVSAALRSLVGAAWHLLSIPFSR